MEKWMEKNLNDVKGILTVVLGKLVLRIILWTVVDWDSKTRKELGLLKRWLLVFNMWRIFWGENVIQKRMRGLRREYTEPERTQDEPKEVEGKMLD